MENPVRTAKYHAVLAERRDHLLKQIDAALPASAEIVWELGSGHGHFLTAYAQANPHEHCVGVDMMEDRVDRARRKKTRAKLPNLDFFHGEAALFLDVLPARLSIGRTFILFPDPWPKLRHHKNRIIRPDFLHALARRVAPTCRLYFRTDHVPYFEAGQATIAAHPDWEIVKEPWPFEFETVFQSRADAHHSLVARRRIP